MSQKTALLAAMFAIGAMYVGASIFHQEDYALIEESIYPTDIFFIAFPLVVIAFAAILVRRHGFVGSHSKAWILFLAGSIVWYAADMTYYYNFEYVVENNEDYTVDYVYYTSYFLYFGFMLFYVWPRKAKVSRKFVLLGAIISLSFIIPSMYFVSLKSDNDNDETMINLIYPFLDAMVFIPAFIALVLFFRGEVNFLWVTVTLGIICMAVADTTFLIERCYGIFSPSSIANMFFAWKWILLAFGAYSHIKIFGATKNGITQ